ncbi:MAG: coiled coil domain-containing protein [bacterium]|nr:coiled coil domain-containing protein [bacterium]
MNDQELHQQKLQAQLDEWKADIDKLKAKAASSSADAQLDLNSLVDQLNAKVQVASTKLAELSNAGADAWDSVKGGVESAWDSLKTSMHEAVAKFKD